MEHDFTNGALRRLSKSDYAVADDDPDVRGWKVCDAAGRELGEVDDLIIDTEARKVRYLEIHGKGTNAQGYADTAGAALDPEHRRVILRSGYDEILEAESLRGMSSAASSSYEPSRDTGAPRAQDVQRLTRAEEEVRLGKRAVQAGEIRVGKHVETEHRRDSVPVMREEVHIERRPVTDPRPVSEIRGAETEEIRVPIIEEEVIVEKRPVVKEELVISKEQVQETREVDVDVRREEFDIDENRGSRTSPDPRLDKSRGGRG